MENKKAEEKNSIFLFTTYFKILYRKNLILDLHQNLLLSTLYSPFVKRHYSDSKKGVQNEIYSNM